MKTSEERFNMVDNTFNSSSGEDLALVKVVIADDHHLYVMGIQAILGNSKDYQFDITGVAHDGEELIKMLRRVKAELLLLDLNMPEIDGLDALGRIRKSYPDLKIIALTTYDDSKIVKSAFKAGVDGYVLKNVEKDELLRGIREVLDGNTFLGQGVQLTAIMENSMKHTDSSLFFDDNFIKKYNLTKRELEILRLIGQALSNKEIAKELFISDQTVSVHRKNIMRKLGVSNTAGLIKLAYDNSLI